MIDGVSSAGSEKLINQRKTIADNFDTFLTLLTTQLKNQNPLDPMDTNQFTQQLVQFTSVEQQLMTNEYLEALLSLSQGSKSGIGDAVSLIGKEISAQTAASELKDGKAVWTYTVSGTVDTAVLTIRDGQGNVVHTAEGSLASGEGRYEWDGRDESGMAMPPGSYSITIDARDAAGAYVPVSVKMVALVEGVDTTGVEPYLIVGGGRISMQSVLSVRDPS